MTLFVVFLAVVPNELDMVKHFLDSVIFTGLHLLLNFVQVHGVLDYIRVVVELEFYFIRSNTFPCNWV